MHEKMHLCHTDLKPENVLFESSGHVVRTRESHSGRLRDYKVPTSSNIKLIDFGRCAT